MHRSYELPFSGKVVSDIYLNIGHFLDHFIMLIFAKAAYDAGREFGLGYEEIIVYGALGFVLFGDPNIQDILKPQQVWSDPPISLRQGVYLVKRPDHHEDNGFISVFCDVYMSEKPEPTSVIVEPPPRGPRPPGPAR